MSIVTLLLSPVLWILSPSVLPYLVGTVAGLAGLAYWFLTKENGKWEALGIKGEKPELFYGNIKKVFQGEVSMMDFYRDWYRKFEGEKYCLLYDGRLPCLMIRDADLIKQITIKDFEYFTDNAFWPEMVGQMEINDFGLFNRSGEEWKSLKTTISPVFSLSRLKNISKIVDKVALEVVESVRPQAESGTPVDVEAMLNSFAMDCLTRFVYSIDVGATRNPGGNEFSKYGDNLVSGFAFTYANVMPWFLKLANIGMLNKESQNFFVNFAEKMIKDRDSNPPKEPLHDALEIMMKASRDSEIHRLDEEAKHKDHDDDDDHGHGSYTGGKINYMTNHQVARNLLQFFVDGYDTIAAQVTLCFYYLALNPDVQEMALEEVDDMVERTKGKSLTGEDANLLKYLDQVMSETCRLGPICFTYRRCTQPWNLPGTNITIPKGFKLIFSMAGLHNDPKYFPEPEKFDPERFSPENKRDIKAGSYLPFGMGPRACIGMKIARTEAKILMYEILRHYRIEPCSKTVVPIKWSVEAFNRIDGGCFVKFIKRN